MHGKPHLQIHEKTHDRYQDNFFKKSNNFIKNSTTMIEINKLDTSDLKEL